MLRLLDPDQSVGLRGRHPKRLSEVPLELAPADFEAPTTRPIESGASIDCCITSSAFIVERHLGRARAAKSLHIMIIDQAMAEEPQPGMPLALATDDALVQKALLVMQQSIDAPLSIGRVVARLEVSRRKLERNFREALGMTPSEADRLVRIEQAKHLLRKTRRSATQIAADTGFCDLPHLIRVFRAAEGMTPDAFRRARART